MVFTTPCHLHLQYGSGIEHSRLQQISFGLALRPDAECYHVAAAGERIHWPEEPSSRNLQEIGVQLPKLAPLTKILDLHHPNFASVSKRAMNGVRIAKLTMLPICFTDCHSHHQIVVARSPEGMLQLDLCWDASALFWGWVFFFFLFQGLRFGIIKHFPILWCHQHLKQCFKQNPGASSSILQVFCNNNRYTHQSYWMHPHHQI